jgi:XTP/dITP diphosphohydrolase
MKLLIATKNKGKVREFAEILKDLPYEIGPLGDDFVMDMEEDRETFLENALKKARYVLQKTGLPALADDSGLCVDALGGLPGIHSARFASSENGGNASDGANNEKLLQLMENVPSEKRTARFVCAIALVFPGGRKLLAEGYCEGSILNAARGSGGFGYDPLFLPLGMDDTYAQLPPAVKHSISHRGRAAEKIKEMLEKTAPDTGSQTEYISD